MKPRSAPRSKSGKPTAGRLSKYRNTPVVVSGKTIASKREARRLAELQLLEKAGKIHSLQTQVRLELLPAQYIDGKCVERAAHYVADFAYFDLDRGHDVIEDAKGYKTPMYRLKKKLMLWVHGIRIEEV